MDPCSVIIVDSNGGKRPYIANLNHRLIKFLEAMVTLTGTTNTTISLGDQIYGKDFNNHTLRELGFRPGMNIELMTSFSGGLIQ